MSVSVFTQSPNDDLDYEFDWADWLQTGETISSYTVTSETGLTIHDVSEADGKVTYWVKGGSGGAKYLVTCQITTSMSRVEEWSVLFKVENR